MKGYSQSNTFGIDPQPDRSGTETEERQLWAWKINGQLNRDQYKKDRNALVFQKKVSPPLVPDTSLQEAY